MQLVLVIGALNDVGHLARLDQPEPASVVWKIDTDRAFALLTCHFPVYIAIRVEDGRIDQSRENVGDPHVMAGQLDRQCLGESFDRKLRRRIDRERWRTVAGSLRRGRETQTIGRLL